MAEKKLRVFCRIFDFVDEVNHELAKIMKDLCIESTLNTMKGKNGITFLMPTDNSFVQELKKINRFWKTGG